MRMIATAGHHRILADIALRLPTLRSSVRLYDRYPGAPDSAVSGKSPSQRRSQPSRLVGISSH
jgi:hypothetical protein